MNLKVKVQVKLHNRMIYTPTTNLVESPFKFFFLAFESQVVEPTSLNLECREICRSDNNVLFKVELLS